MERGDTVRPKRRVIDRTGFSPSSRLRIVRAAKANRYPCKGCRKHPVAERGDLFARATEASSPLCLDCVEPL